MIVLKARWAVTAAGMVALATSACTSPSPPGFRAPGAAIPRIALDRIPDWSVAEARAHLADRTRVSTSGGHGMQVAYTSRDGRSYLWYPGNPMILAGRWKVEARSVTIQRPEGSRTVSQPRICFQYGAETHNPVTGHRGGGWECTSYANLLFAGGQARPGDVFGLARRKAVPFVTGKQDRYSLDELLRKVRGGAR
ncbi:hypothetical protein [Enterovirga rhinocerotis]|uniref:Uncharacterized protein n=1 Tax=Enterovirga rhinocerotis TaxID=1339210 RepID=A0A4R7C9P7_9HYPH|nr:hypothetical protein [Enterovirga rhinocerotis]TDR94772.1 hypothetical protein EV668_2061 [Enterovirga rhinocerotis]